MSIYDDFEKTTANHVALSPLSFIKRTALMFPDRDAVIYGDRCYSWSQLYGRAKQLASALNAHGIVKGDTVAILSANTPEMVEAHFGIPMSGAVLNTINTRLDSDTIGYILDHGEAKVFIVDGELAPQAAVAVAERNILIIDIADLQDNLKPNRIGTIDYADFISKGNVNADWDMPADEWDAIALNYTSGSTGRPKGVVYHHRGAYLMSMGVIADWGLPRHPKYLYTVPMFHCNGWCHGWTMAALAGTIICTRTVSPSVVYNAIYDHGVTHFGGAPIVLGMILNAHDNDRKPFDYTVNVMTAGAPPPAAVLEGIEKLGFDVTQVYGLTETYGHTVMSTWNSDWDNLPQDERAIMKSRQGAGMVHTDGLRVVDINGADVPADGKTFGEILIRGNTVMKGYLKNPQATSEAFADGWFRSEDLAVMHANGYVEIKDRLKDIIISGGENISSVEVEGILHRHPSIALAAVVAMRDEKWGEVPCAFVELKDGASATEVEVINFCREHLAGFKRPKKVVFGDLPKTATGKIQKYELRGRI
jgi:fatty-acyl-CoA synthase|tara:strand:- start:30943 stop:32544 length:1602 start_codon:yes stop_codon:yes gene_type:complete